MPTCKHCGEPIHQTRGGSWVHADGRGIFSWAESGDPSPSGPASQSPPRSADPPHDRDRDGICRACGQGLTALDIVDGEKPCSEE